MNIVKKQGVVEQSAIDFHIENFKRNGFSVFRQLLSPEIVQLVKDAMYRVYERQLEEVGGLENLKKNEG